MPDSFLASKADSLFDTAIGPVDESDMLEESAGVALRRSALKILHVAYFGAVGAIFRVFSCSSAPFDIALSFVDSIPYLPCIGTDDRYRALAFVALGFATLYLIAFPSTLVYVLAKRYRTREDFRNTDNNAKQNGNVVVDDNDDDDGMHDGGELLPSSPLLSMLDLPAHSEHEAAKAKQQREDQHAWSSFLLAGWAQTRPLAELFWLARRTVLAALLALLPSDAVGVQLVLVNLLLLGTIVAQQRVQFFSDQLDQKLDNLSLMTIAAAYNYSRVAQLSDAISNSEWGASDVLLVLWMAALVGFVMLAIVKRAWALKINI